MYKIADISLPGHKAMCNEITNLQACMVKSIGSKIPHTASVNVIIPMNAGFIRHTAT